MKKKKYTKSTQQIIKEMNNVVKMCLTKVKYYSEYEVSRKAKELSLYYYQCPNCNYYHLTKVPRQ